MTPTGQGAVRLVLASGSPRRRDLLGRFGIPFEVTLPQVEEVPRAGELPAEFAQRVAEEKASDVAPSCGPSLILSADTVVALGERILGKPSDPDMAVDMLVALSGRVHSVFTAVVLLDLREGVAHRAIDETRVWFRELSFGEIDRYVREEPVMDKAGAYAIQGGAGAFVPRIRGNYSNVVGLPLPLVHDLLARAGCFEQAGEGPSGPPARPVNP
jgi:septum formation protein